jgi:2-polyprenyl-3-methyl-5-hydroxy-6-metoxy-1,4-benzoquinol methylase
MIARRNEYMDLHDYKNVAENYDLYVDIVCPQGSALNEKLCVDFHLDLAKMYGNKGILDIGCGTGCTMIPLLENGYSATGLDISQEMINVLERKLVNRGLKADLICSDMSEFKTEKEFSLVIMPRSAFIHVIDRERQIKALMNINKHICKDGIVSINTVMANFEFISKEPSGGNRYLRFEYINANGKKEKVYNQFQYNYENQVSTGKWTFEEYDESDSVANIKECEISIRFAQKAEIENLFELCGFKVIGLYGGYDKRECVYPGNLVWVAKKV